MTAARILLLTALWLPVLPWALADETPPIETAPPEGSPAPDGPLIAPPPIPGDAVSAPATKTETPPDIAPEATADAPAEPEAPAHAGAEPAPPASAASDSPAQSTAAVPGDDEYHPLYQLTHPSWGFQLHGTWSALGDTPLVAGLPGSKAAALAMELDYQPPFLQSIGVVAVGLSAGILPVSSAEPMGPKAIDFWQAGAHLTYQARFFREQILVPTVGFAYEHLSYSLTTGGGFEGYSGTSDYAYPTFGAMLLLNAFEPSQASTLFQEFGIKRSYLTFEARALSAVAGNRLPTDGMAYFFGLRVEF
jgi:hypothetical protein